MITRTTINGVDVQVSYDYDEMYETIEILSVNLVKDSDIYDILDEKQVANLEEECYSDYVNNVIEE